MARIAHGGAKKGEGDLNHTRHLDHKHYLGQGEKECCGSCQPIRNDKLQASTTNQLNDESAEENPEIADFVSRRRSSLIAGQVSSLAASRRASTGSERALASRPCNTSQLTQYVIHMAQDETLSTKAFWQEGKKNIGQKAKLSYLTNFIPHPVMNLAGFA
ncbi:hypothetical protein MUK42_34231 [Musa troglodytarum]|uniref:Uncharacterized protein n=1 Tax=Musa troglodytarum TaxID=320322 RepID=A0A9E7EE55_9LILI|nr:hypothetical protein MUK42_34231 [Musa troglodytarum]